MHRPRYDDWTLPKGKLEPGETDAGRGPAGGRGGDRPALRPRAGAAGSRDIDRKGRPKNVRYWAMTPAAATPDDWEFVPNKEVDALRWVTPAEAAPLLSYDRDRRVMKSFQPPVAHRGR